MTENQHSACVHLWTRKLADAPDVEQLVEVLEETFAVLWARAQRTLGDATLAAIVERVIVSSASRFSPVGAIRVDLGGVHCDELLDELRTAATTREEFIDAASAVLEEFLARLGRLTGEILTPALHDELVSMQTDEEGDTALRSAGARAQLKAT